MPFWFMSIVALDCCLANSYFLLLTFFGIWTVVYLDFSTVSFKDFIFVTLPFFGVWANLGPSSFYVFFEGVGLFSLVLVDFFGLPRGEFAID